MNECEERKKECKGRTCVRQLERRSKEKRSLEEGKQDLRRETGRGWTWGRFERLGWHTRL